MGIGKMRERVKVYEYVVDSQDALGGQNTTKTLMGEFWANVEQSTGTRESYNQTVYNKGPYTVTMRTGSYAITPNNILEFEGTELTIQSIVTDPLKRYTIAQCQANQV